MSCKRITAVLLSVIVVFSVCMPAFGAEDAQTLNAEAPVDEEVPASPESADKSEEPALLEYADGTEELASSENAGGTEEPDSADLLEEPNVAEEQPAEEQLAAMQPEEEQLAAIQPEEDQPQQQEQPEAAKQGEAAEQMETAEQEEAAQQMEEDREAVFDKEAGKSIAQAIWTQDNDTLTFCYGPLVSEGDEFEGEIVTEVWSGKDVTDTGRDDPEWIDTLDYNNYVVHVVFDDSFSVVRPTSTHAWFRYFRELTDIDLGGLDTSEVTDMSGMFDDCVKLTHLDVSGFDTAKVTNMQGMFWECSSLTSLDVSGFDTSEVKNMVGMFWYCSSLTSIDLSEFDTQNVTVMGSMFSGCGNLTSLDLSSLDTHNVTGMYGMFSNCDSLTSLNISGIDTSGVSDMSYMFQGCSKLTDLNMSGLDTSEVTDMSGMFEGCASLSSLDVSGFDTSKVSIMSGMFANCTNLASLDVSNFDTSKVNDMTSMFEGCASLSSLDVSKFDTSNVTDMTSMFAKCSGLTSLDVTGFNTSKVSYMDEMFSFLTLTSLDLSGFDMSNMSGMDGMFRGCKKLKTIYCRDNRDVWGFDDFAWGDEMFDSCYALVGSDGRSEIAYNKNRTDISMAKAAGMGGYFTPKINTLVLKKTARGDMFNLANAVKITWKAVPDAKYYKVYRKDITSGVQSKYELVFVTSKLIGWDKDPRLSDGHAYKYKIVASLTGKGDSSGDSPFSYFKTMYRLKTVVIRTAKNTEPGKVTVRYDKTKSGDSYVIGYSENEEMTGMKTKVVKGADSTSCTIGGLKKGKTYYFSIRVRKNVDGVNYYTTFGVPRKVTVTQ